MLRIRNNGTTHEIIIPSDQLEVVQKIVKSNVSEVVKESIIKPLSGGAKKEPKLLLCKICQEEYGIPSWIK